MSAAFPLSGYRETALVDPFEVFIGPVYEQGEPPARRFAFLVDARHVNMRGVIHGGMLMSFADAALGQAVWDVTDRAPSVTLGMQSQFLKGAKLGDVVQVKPELVRRTRSFVFMRGDFQVDGETVFAATSVWKLLGQD
jgi:acyl-coenzyme A thioesterase PaaI-like protein